MQTGRCLTGIKVSLVQEQDKWIKINSGCQDNEATPDTSFEERVRDTGAKMLCRHIILPEGAMAFARDLSGGKVIRYNDGLY